MTSPVQAALACPACGAAAGEGAEACPECGRPSPWRGRWRDFAPDVGEQSGLAQAVMESPPIASIYERVFRPAFTRLGSSITYAQEDAWLAREFHPVEGPVLDIACGTGRYARWIAGRVGASRVVGLDLSAAMLDRAVAHARGERGASSSDAITYLRGSAMALPFADASLGAVNCFGALHLFPDAAGALAEVGRVLRPGGSFTCLTAIECREGIRGRVQAAFSQVATFRFFEPTWLEDALGASALGLRTMDQRGMVVLFSARRSAKD